jgi:hypothetical protein
MPVRNFALVAIALAALALAGPSAAQGYGTPGAPPRAGIVRPDTDDNLQWAAAVVRVDGLRRQGELSAKLFGTAGGDPAMNGLYTYLAFFGSPDESWRVFRLGDFLSYRILSETPGRLALEVRESVMDRGSGAIGARTRRMLVSWRPGAGGEPPASVAVAAAR